MQPVIYVICSESQPVIYFRTNKWLMFALDKPEITPPISEVAGVLVRVIDEVCSH